MKNEDRESDYMENETDCHVFHLVFNKKKLVNVKAFVREEVEEEIIGFIRFQRGFSDRMDLSFNMVEEKLSRFSLFNLSVYWK